MNARYTLMAIVLVSCAESDPEEWLIDLPRTAPIIMTGNAVCPEIDRLTIRVQDPMGVPYIKEEDNPSGLSCYGLPNAVMCNTNVGTNLASLWLNPLSARYTFEFRQNDIVGMCIYDFGQMLN